MESTTEHKPITHSLYFPNEYSMDHVNLALDCKLQKATYYNGSILIHKAQSFGDRASHGGDGFC